MIATEKLESLVETTHLLRSARNAERLLTALARAKIWMRTGNPNFSSRKKGGFRCVTETVWGSVIRSFQFSFRLSWF